MSDDLVKRLRFFGPPIQKEAADRIEELEAACWRMQEERDRAIGWRDSDKDRADKAEAKLAQAVKLIELAVELAQWNLNPKLRDDMVDFTTTVKGEQP